jgi:hypothetical protein
VDGVRHVPPGELDELVAVHLEDPVTGQRGENRIEPCLLLDGGERAGVRVADLDGELSP